MAKKTTLQPCDIDFGEEIKGKLLGKIIFKYPKFAKFLDKTFSFWAALFVIINIWSLVYVAISGLNLWVYDTCNPYDSQGCSLSGDACGIGSNKLGFGQAVQEKRLREWATGPFVKLGETISLIPNRLKKWEAKDYLMDNSTFYYPEDSNKKYAIEAIDPGCSSCKQLFENISKTDFKERYNLTYLLYPIKNSSNQNYRFQFSLMRAQYVETIKDFEPLNPKNTEVAYDWQLVEMLFTKQDKGTDLQNAFNLIYTEKEAVAKLEELLLEIGYSPEQIVQISESVNSPEIQVRLDEQRNVVEKKIKTIKIPTIIFNGKRYDRVVETEKLK